MQYSKNYGKAQNWSRLCAGQGERPTNPLLFLLHDWSSQLNHWHKFPNLKSITEKNLFNSDSFHIFTLPDINTCRREPCPSRLGWHAPPWSLPTPSTVVVASRGSSSVSSTELLVARTAMEPPLTSPSTWRNVCVCCISTYSVLQWGHNCVSKNMWGIPGFPPRFYLIAVASFSFSLISYL